MNIERFWELQREADALYEAGKYQEVINFAERVADQFPDLKPPIYYPGICAAAKLERYDLACELLKEILDEGGWFSEMILRQSPSLKPLQGMSEFEELVDISLERSKHASKKDYNLTVFPENANPPYPLMLVLHAGGGGIKEEYEAWKSIVDRGYVLGMPRSTDVFWSSEQCAYWMNPESATDQIRTYVDKLNVDNSFDFKHSIIGGLSSGGSIAIRLALSGIIPARGFVVASPGGPWTDNPEIWQPLIDDAKEQDLQGIIILGEKDAVIPRESIEKLVKMLNDGCIPCKFIEYPDLGHWYPPDIVDIVMSFTADFA